ncbi:hypothetical protein DUGA2_64460 [Duganella sp. HH101]|nr:hypothetical protein DUGA2_64460 [Duganella sp. HH101]
MVHRQQHDVLRLAQTQQARTDQRTGGQVERCLRLVLHQPLRLGIALRMRQVRQIGRLQRQLQFRCDHLHRRAVHAGKAGTQGFMAAYDLVQCTLKGRHVELSIQTDRRRNIVERAARLELVEEPQALLRERQRHALFALDRRQGRYGQTALCRFHARQQAGDCWRLEHRAQRQFDFERATDLRHQLRRQQRVAAQREEVVVYAHFVKPENTGPDTGHDLFSRRTWRHVALLAARHVRRGQGFAIHFAVRRQWHLFQYHEVGRHHVLRQRRQQGSAQSGGIRQFCVVVRDQIRHQPLVARHVLARQHQCVAHRRQSRQGRLDLAEFDAEAAQLDLIVDPAQVFDAAVLQIARQVARLVHAAARSAERVRNEFVRRQVATVQVAACQAFTGDMQLAGHARRHGVQACVEDVDLRVGDRLADHRCAIERAHAPQRRPDRCFGRAVQVPDRVDMAEHIAHQAHRQRFAAAQHLQLQFLRPAMIDQHAPARRRGLHHRRA